MPFSVFLQSQLWNLHCWQTMRSQTLKDQLVGTWMDGYLKHKHAPRWHQSVHTMGGPNTGSVGTFSAANRARFTNKDQR